MKKYIAPAINKAEIELESMIAASPSTDLSSDEEITGESQFESKENYGDVSSWDEDEEEDITYAYRHKSIW